MENRWVIIPERMHIGNHYFFYQTGSVFSPKVLRFDLLKNDNCLVMILKPVKLHFFLFKSRFLFALFFHKPDFCQVIPAARYKPDEPTTPCYFTYPFCLSTSLGFKPFDG